MKPGTVLDFNGIQKVLPHRPPFLFLDRVDEILPPKNRKNNVGQKIVAFRHMSPQEYFFEGHFPGKPIVPGVILIETMAQASVICAFDPDIHGTTASILLLSVDKAKLRKPVFPGMDLRVESTITKDKMNIFVFHAEIYNGEIKMAEADFKARIDIKK